MKHGTFLSLATALFLAVITGASCTPDRPANNSLQAVTPLPIASPRPHQPFANPSFPISSDEAQHRLLELQKQPKKLERPLVILGGFLDPGFGPDRWKRSLGNVVSGQIITITFADLYSFQSFRERVVKTLDDALGPASPTETAEVDVIGQSMGGLVALYSALNDPALGKRVRIHSLFTISSPLTGAKLAMLTPFNVFSYQADMRPDSNLYRRINKQKFNFPIYSYTRLDDTTVGEMFASLPGLGLWWLDNPPGERAHVGVFRDSRVLLDVALRLRGEKPVATYPPAPIPATMPSEERD